MARRRFSLIFTHEDNNSRISQFLWPNCNSYRVRLVKRQLPLSV